MVIKNGKTMQCLPISRSSHRRCSVKKVALKNFLQACNFIKKRLQHRCLPVKFAKYLETPTVHLRQLYQNILHHNFFFWSLAHFPRAGIKSNSHWIAQNILSKEIKQILQRRGRETGVAMELLKKSEPLAKFYCTYFQNILSMFFLNAVSMDRYQIRWLLSSGKGVEVYGSDTCS